MKKDLLVPIKPYDLTAILAREQTYLFSKHDLRNATRLWLYETYPVSSLRYLATVGPVKRPRQIPRSERSGSRNVDAFNSRSIAATYAYEIRRLDKLDEPVPYKEMVERKWAKGAPQPFAYPLPAMLEMLEKGRIGRRVVFDVRKEAEAKAAEAEMGKADVVTGKAEVLAAGTTKMEAAEKAVKAKTVEKAETTKKVGIVDTEKAETDGRATASAVDKDLPPTTQGKLKDAYP